MLEYKAAPTSYNGFYMQGLGDECTVRIRTMLLGSGIRLFENMDKNKFNIEISDVIPSKLSTHIKYSLMKK